MPKSPKSKPATRLTGPSGSRSTSQRVAQLNKWREQYNPLRGLTLTRGVQLAEAYFRGEMADYQWACFFVEQTDPDLFALLEMRLGRILQMDYDFVAEKGADEAAAERQKKRLTEKFARIDNLNEAFEHLALAPFRHFSHLEKWYEGGELIHLEPVDQWNVVRDGLRGAWRYNPEAKSCTYQSLGTEADMPPEQFVFREVRRAINRIALFKFIRANLSEKDWDAFVEIFGFLGGVVIGPPDIQQGQVGDFTAAAEKVAEGGSGFLPHGSDYKVNPTAKGAHPFKERLDHLSEKLVLVGTGGKLTMLTESGSGTLAGGAHADVFDQIAAGEAKRIAEVFNTQVIPEMLDGEKAVVYMRLAANAETDTAAAVEEVSKLSIAGFAVDPDEVSERTGWTVTVKPAAPPPPFGFGGQPGAIPNRARIANRQDKAALESAFRSASIKQLSEAQAKALRPLVQRIEAILALPDEKIDGALQALKRDLPRINREILRDEQTRFAFEQILSAAFVQGAATSRENQTVSS